MGALISAKEDGVESCNCIRWRINLELFYSRGRAILILVPRPLNSLPEARRPNCVLARDCAVATQLRNCLAIALHVVTWSARSSCNQAVICRLVAQQVLRLLCGCLQGTIAYVVDTICKLVQWSMWSIMTIRPWLPEVVSSNRTARTKINLIIIYPP